MQQGCSFRILSFLLVLCLAASVLTACMSEFPPINTDTAEPATSDDVTTQADTTDAVTTDAVISLPEDYDLPVSEVPETMPDVLSLLTKDYVEMPVFSTQDELSEFAMYSFLGGKNSFECYIARELVPDEITGYRMLSEACSDMRAYFLFTAYTEFDMFTEDRGDTEGVYAKVTLIFDCAELDLEARAEALEYVMKNPVPKGGFTTFEDEREYARGIHDFIARKVTYSPIGYKSNAEMFGFDRYTNKQEAYTCLGEDQDSTVCAGYARAFALIAHYAGINAAWVWGNETEVDSHAWNIVYPCDGGEPMLVDITWDDCDGEGMIDFEYTWFYVPLSLVDDHIIDESMVEFLNYLNDVEIPPPWSPEDPVG